MLGFVLVVIIGIIDYLTGYELAFSEFYVLPIALLTWFTDRRLGFTASVICALVWLAADIFAGHRYEIPFIPFWNTLIRLAFFVIITALLSALRNSLERERELARFDFLTGAITSRYFYEIIKNELDRFQRYGHPFTLVYIDLDDFKRINDQYGHATGDQVLRSVVNSAKAHFRKTDRMARLGGDEFALLLPETDAESARAVLAKITGFLRDDLKRGGFPITFSIGTITVMTAEHSVDDLIRAADDLMYSVKMNGKNSVGFATIAPTGQL